MKKNPGIEDVQKRAATVTKVNALAATSSSAVLQLYELPYLRAAFSLFDADGDGKLTEDEVEAAVAAAEAAASRAVTAEAVVGGASADGDAADDDDFQEEAAAVKKAKKRKAGE